MDRKLYEILGVPENADKAEIKKAYKKLAKEYHPDRNKSADATEKMKEINKAYSILEDDEKRALYDEYGELAIEADFNKDVLNRYRTSWNYDTSGMNDGGFGPGSGWPFGFDDDFLNNIFSGGGMGGQSHGGFREQYQPRAQKGENLESEINIDFMKAVKGGQESVSFMIHNGQGQPEHVTYDITIPKGIREGQKIRLAGKGAPGINGGPAGDLMLKVKIRPDARFTREGDDIITEVPVSFTKAILGGEVDVPTLDGEVTLKIPAGTQPGQKFRLRGKGVVTAKNTGDEYAKIKVTIPKDINEKQKELIEQFETAGTDAAAA